MIEEWVAAVAFALCIAGALLLQGCTAAQKQEIAQAAVVVENDLHAASVEFGAILADVKQNKQSITGALLKAGTYSPKIQKIIAPAVTALNNGDLDTAIAVNSDLTTATAPRTQ